MKHVHRFEALIMAGLLSGAFSLTSCSSSSDSTGEIESESRGTLSVPLIANSGGHVYKLQGQLIVSGPTYAYLDVGSESSVVTTSLPTGNYTAYLNSWALTRDDGVGNFLPVVATLLSNYGQSFTIFNQANTSIAFEFETNGEVVAVGSGHLGVRAVVSETAPICTILGTDCPMASWCAPTRLTGQPLACIASGTVPAWAACDSPLDCEANTSCFDFGAGAVCSPLCRSPDFDMPCATGGTCTPQGATYGVCVPDVQASASAADTDAV